jgi:hypothetical protein
MATITLGMLEARVGELEQDVADIVNELRAGVDRPTLNRRAVVAHGSLEETLMELKRLRKAGEVGDDPFNALRIRILALTRQLLQEVFDLDDTTPPEPARAVDMTDPARSKVVRVDHEVYDLVEAERERLGPPATFSDAVRSLLDRPNRT